MKYEVTIPVKVIIEAEDKEEAREEASSYLYKGLTTGFALILYNPEKEVHMCEPSEVYQIIDLKEI